jgi:hypothetical protein
MDESKVTLTDRICSYSRCNPEKDAATCATKFRMIEVESDAVVEQERNYLPDAEA